MRQTLSKKAMNSALKTDKATQSALAPKNARALSKQKPYFADFCEPLLVVGARKMIRIRFYPFVTKKRNSAKYLAILGLGSNMNDEKFTLKKLFRLLIDDKRIKVLASSSLLINKAFGFVAQRDFTNAVLFVQSALHARALLKVLLHYELKFKRQRSFKNAPRTLDIDLLYFSAKCHNDGFCTLPHTGVSERISVILPLGEILERKV